MEKKYTREQILGFNESDWVFRRSNGYAGYDRVDQSNNKSTWIYEADYYNRKRLKEDYNKDYTLIAEFRSDQLPLGTYPDFHIQEFLNTKYFVLEETLALTPNVMYELKKDIQTPSRFIPAGEKRSQADWEVEFPNAFLFKKNNEWFTEVGSKQTSNDQMDAIIDTIFDNEGLHSMTYKAAAKKAIIEYVKQNKITYYSNE